MLLNNQRITLDFASKTPVKINNIMYKGGEKDRDGIIIEGLNVNIQETDGIVVYWLYSTQDLYIFVPTLGERISETEIKTLPPRGVLQRGEVGVEVIVLGADGSELKSQSGYIPVQASLIQEDYSGDADDDVSITMQLIAQATDLHQAAIALNAQMATAHQGRIDAENLREGKFDAHEANLIQKRDGVASATSATNTAKDGANTAKANADSKASLANSKATLAQTATTNANNAKTAADASVASANTIKSQLETSTSSANTAKANADSKANLANTKATLANDKATLANTAAINADNARNKVAAIPGEIAKARTGMDGVVHANLNERLRKDFEFIGKKLPVSKTSSGSGEVVFDGSLSGDVSGVVATGQTLVNLVKVPLKNASKNLTVGTNGIIRITNTNRAMFVAGKTYTVMAKVIFTKKPEETSSTAYAYPEFVISKAGGGYQYVKPIDVTKLTIKDTPINTPVSNVSKFVLDPTYDGSVFYEDISAVHVTVAGLFEATCETIVLEGDHTDKPLSFFEGLKSAELETVTSHGVNLFDGEWIDNSYLSLTQGSSWGTLIPTSGHKVAKNFIPVAVGKTYKFASHASAIFGYDNNFKTISNLGNNYTDTVIPQGVKYIRFYTTDTNTINHKGIAEKVFVGLLPLPHQESKTTLSEPITLRSLPNGVADTHDFDTQTLVRRCGEVVLNGTESWGVHTSGADYIAFSCVNALPVNSIIAPAQSDKFPLLTATGTNEGVNTWSNRTIYVSIAKSKLATPDVAGFKAWLQANNTTVVYQLATPTIETVETSGQLRSYDYQTAIGTDSIIPPKITATAPIDFTTSLATIANGISTVSNNDNAEYLSTEMSIIHDELNAIKATLVITPEA